MTKLGALGFGLAMTAMAVGASTSSAHAYLDPGTGSLILQILLGGIAGLVVAIKLYWHRFLALCGRQVQESNQLSHRRSVEADERSRPR